MKIKQFLFLFFFCMLATQVVYCQKNDTLIISQDSIRAKNVIRDTLSKMDSASLARKKHDPTKATLYSTVFPGLGQIYNKKYWKLPLVYAAVGIPVYFFFNDRLWFDRIRYALAVVANGSYNNPDSVSRVNPQLIPFVRNLDINGLIKYRNQYRQWEDYSILFFLLFYALQIVDATVDAHLKDFNVNSDLSFHFKPNLSTGIGAAGLGLVLDFHKPRPKPVFDTR